VFYPEPRNDVLCVMHCSSHFYLRQVNEVNGGDNVRCVSVFLCVCLCVRSGPVNLTSLKWELNANSSKTVKATDFKFDSRVPRDSPDVIL